MQRIGHHHVVLGDVLVELLEVHFLLVAGAKQAGLLHAGDGEHRLVVELGVVQPVQQVDAARPRGRDADADFAGRLRVRAGHERGGFFVVHEHKRDLVLMAAQRFEEPVDAVAGQPVDGVDAPVDEPRDKRFRSDLLHRVLLQVAARSARMPSPAAPVHTCRDRNCR